MKTIVTPPVTVGTEQNGYFLVESCVCDFHMDRKLVPSLRSGLTISGQELIIVTAVRFLGVLLDECLNFSNHTNSVVCKVSRYTSIVYKFRMYLT